jgi:putative endonuclease
VDDAAAGRGARGRRGEAAAQALLERHAYRIVDANVRFGRTSGLIGELDIVAWDGPTLCFVEVKTRRAASSARHRVFPVENVTPAKQRQIARLALAYAMRHGLLDDDAAGEIPLRFDVVAVTLHPDGETVRDARLLRGAFFAPEDLETG